jgi:hypothetical protein
MSHHMSSGLTVVFTLAATLSGPAFAQHPTPEQSQSLSASQYTVIFSDSTAIAPPVAPPAWPPDVAKCLAKTGVDMIPIAGDVVGTYLSGQEAGAGLVARDPLHTEWATAEAMSGRIPLIGEAYGSISDGVEAGLRWYLYQHGMSRVEDRDAWIIATKDDVTRQLNHVLADNYMLGPIGSIAPVAVINVALNQILKVVVGTLRSETQFTPPAEGTPEYDEWQRNQAQVAAETLDSETQFLSPDPVQSEPMTQPGGTGLTVGAVHDPQLGTKIEILSPPTSSSIPFQLPEEAAPPMIDPAGTITTMTGQVVDPSTPDSEVQISSEVVDNEPPLAVSFSGSSIVDDGPLIRPQPAASPSSGGFWNLQNLLQIGAAALQGYQIWSAAHSNPAPAVQSAQKGKGQSPTGQQKPWCTGPSELCAAEQLVRATCSIRNDCSKWAWVPLPPPSAAPTPSQGCSIQCMTVGYSINGLPITQCVGNAFTPACPNP